MAVVLDINILCNKMLDLTKSASLLAKHNVKVKCLGEGTRKNPVGMIEHLVVEESRLQGKPILIADQTLETVVLVSLELAESMLRRNFWGMDFIPVEVAGR